MKERKPLNREGVIIERVATDYGLWMTLVALHFASKHYKDVKSNGISLLTQICCNLILKNVLDDELFVKILLSNITENTRATFQDIQNLFGYKTADAVMKFSREHSSYSDVENYLKNIGTKKYPKKLEIIEERYPLNRDCTFLEEYATDNGIWPFLLSLHFANKHYLGMIRDDGSPEISHSARIVCDTIDRGVKKGSLFTKEMLHDIIENTKITVDDIKKIFNFDMADGINRLSKKPEDHLDPEIYFGEILATEDTAVSKAVDMENVISDAIVCYPPPRLRKKVNEIKEHGFRMMKTAREAYPKYKGIFFSCRNHIQRIILGIEKYLKVVEIGDEVFKIGDNIRKDIGELEKSISHFKEKSADLLKDNYKMQALLKDMKDIEKKIKKTKEEVGKISSFKKLYKKLVWFDK